MQWTDTTASSRVLGTDNDSTPDCTKRRTILLLDHTAMMSGGEIALLHLVRHIDHNRYEPVVALSSNGPLVEELQAAGIETHVLPLAPSVVEARKDHLDRNALTRVRDMARLVAYCFKLAAFIRRRHVDLLHTNSLKADIFGGLAGRLARVSILWHVRDRIENDYLPPKVVRVFRYLCRTLPHYVIANSAATLSTLHLPEQKGRVVHDGVPVTSCDVTTSTPEYSSATPCIGIIGRISPWKGQHVFLEAAARVHQEFPEARFQIIGSALFGEEDYAHKLHQQQKDLQLNGSVEWLGFRSDVPELVKRLDILVHASTVGEPFGQVVVEGMAESKPVVATRGGGVPEIIEDGVSGVLVPMNDARAMADAVLKLLRDPQHAQTIGKAARARVQSHFAIERTARQIEQIYEMMLKRR